MNHHQPRRRATRAWLVFILCGGLIAALDLWSKPVVFELLDVVTVEDHGRPRVASQKHFVVIEDLFWLEANYNYGAFSGWFGGHTRALALISALALIVIAVIFAVHARQAARTEWMFVVSLGLLWGGTLGNLYDRWFLSGVRDWIRWFVVIDGKHHVWPNFNVADAAIVSGVVLLVLREIRAAWLARKGTEKEADHQGQEVTGTT